MNRKLADLREAHRRELERLRGQAKAVVVTRPAPWAPARLMVELHKEGEDVRTIAKKTGYSVATVESALKTEGSDPRSGAHCPAGRQFTVEEALTEMPLPCGPDCVCSYRPVFKWE